MGHSGGTPKTSCFTECIETHTWKQCFIFLSNFSEISSTADKMRLRAEPKITHRSGFGYKTLWWRVRFQQTTKVVWNTSCCCRHSQWPFFQKAVLPKHTWCSISSLSTTLSHIVFACMWLLLQSPSRKQQLSTKCCENYPACAKQLHQRDNLTLEGHVPGEKQNKLFPSLYGISSLSHHGYMKQLILNTRAAMMLF